MNSNSGKNLTHNIEKFFSGLARGWSAQRAIIKGKGGGDKLLRIPMNVKVKVPTN
jgi:hypothetical protein